MRWTQRRSGAVEGEEQMTWERFAGASLLRMSITLQYTLQHTLLQTFKAGEEEIFNWRLTPWKISHF
jgi:hypothetical protein